MSIFTVVINSLKSLFIVSLFMVSQSSASRYLAGKIISEECGSSRLSLITPIPNDVESRDNSSQNSCSSETSAATKELSFAQDEFETVWNKLSLRLPKLNSRLSSNDKSLIDMLPIDELSS